MPQCEYVYDAWGNHRILSAAGEDITDNAQYANSISHINPFRYRGYYYDTETGFCYLNSRYYDPQVRRFINADDPSVPSGEQSTVFGGLNLYAYCLNNPVNMVDQNGNSPEWWQWLLAGIGLALTIAAVTILTSGVGTATLLGSIAVGAAKGALIGAGAGIIGGGAIGYAINGAEGMLQGAMIGLGIGAIAGAIIGGTVGGIRYSISKPWGRPFDPDRPLVQEGVDPRTVFPQKNLKMLDPERLKRVELFGRDQAIEVYKNGVINQGHHRVANAIKFKRTIDVIIRYNYIYRK